MNNTTPNAKPVPSKVETADAVYWILRAIRDTVAKSRHDDPEGDFYQAEALAELAMEKIQPLLDPES